MSTATLPPPAPSKAPIDEEALYEVVGGVRLELPDMSKYSNLIASRIDRQMAAVAETGGLGTVSMENLFILDSVRNLRRRPDVAFVSAERWPLDREIPEEGDWEVVPDLCVEVTNPNDLYNDVMGKVQEYFEHGVRQVWVVWPPRRQVYVYRSPDDVTRLTSDDILSTEEIVPGFQIAVDRLFQPTPVTR